IRYSTSFRRTKSQIIAVASRQVSSCRKMPILSIRQIEIGSPSMSPESEFFLENGTDLAAGYEHRRPVFHRRAQTPNNHGERPSSRSTSSRNIPQKAGIRRANQYVAARNRLGGPKDTDVRTGRGPKLREYRFESHRQFYPQGQRHRARRQALRGPDRREHSSRQGNTGEPDRNAPHQRWR